MKNKVEYKLEAYKFDIFDNWKEYNINYIVEEFWNDILLIQNKNSKEFTNIFKDSKINTNTSDWISIYWVKLKINDLENCEYEVDDEDENEHKIKKWIKNHTIEIKVKWYLQDKNDYYYILIKDLNKKEKIEKQLEWLERIFTIIGIKVTLYEREVIEEKEKKYYNEWKEGYTLITTEQYPNVEKMALELCKINGIKDTSNIKIPTILSK